MEGMMLNYRAIEIFTSEEARYLKKPVSDAVMQYIKELKIAARCIVTRGVAGCYENGELTTTRLEILSFNLPVRIYIIIPAAETDRVLNGLNEMVTDGIIALHDLSVISHRTRKSFFPRQLLVRDVMTTAPKYVIADTSLSDATRLLISHVFTGLPVIDDQNRPIGMITQGDLIYKGGLPVRLGLLKESDQDSRESLIHQLGSRNVSEIMTTPVVIIAADKPLTDAVKLMEDKGVKRLPVTDAEGSLVGMLSRVDIFRTVMREAPDWNAFKAQKIEVKHLKQVKDILRRDTQTVFPETTLDEVIRIIDRNDIQRVAVIDDKEKLVGLISDRDLLRYFKPEQEKIWRLLAKIKHPFKSDAGVINDLQQRLKKTTADSVMTIKLITVNEDMLIEDGIRLMVEKGLKRLPVVDTEGRFKGMISRDSLLRTGF
jgi:CBS domain-containing protein